MMFSDQKIRTFFLIWLGQTVSLLGTSMTRFALLIWAYQQTGEAMTVALLGFFSFAPFVLISPLAGVVLDRVDRRWVMATADLGAGIMTMVMLVLYHTGYLAIWHLYAAEAVTGVLEAFQMPAYDALVGQLIPKSHYTRASGLRSLGMAAGRVVAPMLAGALLPFIYIDGVMGMDLATFGIAMLTLVMAQVPKLARPQGETEAPHFKNELRTGLAYIWHRPGLRGILAIMTGINLFAAISYFAILPALILARTGQDEWVLGLVQGSLGVGGVLGGVAVSVWGGPRRKIHGLLGFTAVSFLLGDFLFAVGRTTAVWVAAGIISAFFIPFIMAAYRAIWQSKVPLGLQGRVFAVQGALDNATMPVGYLLGGWLADGVFEPALRPQGVLAPWLGWLVGTGAGAGMGAMFLGTAVLGCAVALYGYAVPAVRHVEQLPDHDEVG